MQPLDTFKSDSWSDSLASNIQYLFKVTAGNTSAISACCCVRCSALQTEALSVADCPSLLRASLIETLVAVKVNTAATGGFAYGN